MRQISKLVVVVGVLGVAGTAFAGKPTSIDDMFASANSKAGKGSAKASHAKAAPSARAKVAAQPRLAAASKAAPNRASKAPAAPPPSVNAPPAGNAGPAPVANAGNTMVLADYAPDRHALAGP